MKQAINQEPTAEGTTNGYTLHDAIKFFKEQIQNEKIKRTNGQPKIAALRVLVKNSILNNDEINDIRLINLNTLPDRMIHGLKEHMTANTVETYINRGHLAIRQFLEYKDTGKFKVRYRRTVNTMERQEHLIDPDYFRCFFPIRQDKTVIRLDNIPRNLNSKDVDIITTMVKTVLTSNMADF